MVRLKYISKYYLLIIGFTFFVGLSVFGQASSNTDNPFEVEDKIEENVPATEPTIEIDPNNPFELIDNGTKQIPTSNTELRKIEAPINTTNTRKVAPPKPKPIEEETTSTIDDGETTDDITTTTFDKNNPFELVKNGNKAVFASQPNVAVNNKGKKQTGKKKKKQKRTFVAPAVNAPAFVKFIALVIIIGFIAFIRNVYSIDLSRINKAFLNGNMMDLLYRDKGGFVQLPNMLLYLLYALTGGVFLFLLLGFFKISLFDSQILSLLICIIGLAAAFFIKHTILNLIASIFPFKKEISFYNYTIGIFNQVLGMLLIPVIAFIAFSPANLQTTAVYAGLGLILLVYLFRFIRTLPLVVRFLEFHKFHLIIYLCTVEIAPTIILLKTLNVF